MTDLRAAAWREALYRMCTGWDMPGHASNDAMRLLISGRPEEARRTILKGAEDLPGTLHVIVDKPEPDGTVWMAMALYEEGDLGVLMQATAEGMLGGKHEVVSEVIYLDCSARARLSNALASWTARD